MDINNYNTIILYREYSYRELQLLFSYIRKNSKNTKYIVNRGKTYNLLYEIDKSCEIDILDDTIHTKREIPNNIKIYGCVNFKISKRIKNGSKYTCYVCSCRLNHNNYICYSDGVLIPSGKHYAKNVCRDCYFKENMSYNVLSLLYYTPLIFLNELSLMHNIPNDIKKIISNIIIH
jgi:hypothetical protein